MKKAQIAGGQMITQAVSAAKMTKKEIIKSFLMALLNWFKPPVIFYKSSLLSKHLRKCIVKLVTQCLRIVIKIK